MAQGMDFAAASPALLPTHPLPQFVAGMLYPFRALAFMQRHRLWRAAAVPLAVNAALLLGLTALTWAQVLPLLNRAEASAALMAGDAPVIALGVGFLKWMAWLFLLPVALALATVATILLGQVIASPFLDVLSERVEVLRSGGQEAPSGLRRCLYSLSMAVADALWSVLYLALFYLPSLLVGWVPGVGVALSMLCAALFLAHEFVGLSMTRHFVSYRQRWRAVLRNRWICGGFGLVAAVLWAVPGLNLLLLPLAAVAGTLLFCDLRAAGRLAEI